MRIDVHDPFAVWLSRLAPRNTPWLPAPIQHQTMDLSIDEVASVEETQKRFDKHGADQFLEKEEEFEKMFKQGFEAFAKQIEAAVVLGKVDSRTPLGQKFSPALQEYSKLEE